MFEKYKKVYKADYEKWYKENEAYRERVAADQDRLKFHLMPKTGWLNDPNGLCQFNGTYHIYYQYTPFEPTGELKTWGHYTTKDFIHYEDHGVAMYPDTESDSYGCYTGMALNEYGWWYFNNGLLDLNYTGIASNEYGSWYYRNGNIAYDYSGTVADNGKTYTVQNGFVIA